jgi:membrane fusion protein, multidrug efflux system
MPIRVGEYVAAGTRMLSVVPTDNLWIEANYRETQTGRMKVGDPARIRFNGRDAGAALARPGMSVETAVAVSTADNASPSEGGNRVACSFDPPKDTVERSLTKLPVHPGLGRACPQGFSGTQIPVPPAR